MENIRRYFPELTDRQIEQLAQLEPLYREWNDKINVVSRKDIDNLYDHHVLHSLSIAKVVDFKPAARVLDLGTGGGLPGIPLAILFPETHFTLIDGTRKKITVVNALVEALELPNVTARQQRVEECRDKFDFVISRAVAGLDKLVQWSFPRIREQQQHVLPNGLLALKGGNLRAEIKQLERGAYTEIYPLSKYYDLPYYEEKYIVYVQW